MRFESVVAHAFGPFQDRRLDLAPGLNVVFGPNEAGKTTLHAALFAGLCGRRRGRGQPTKEDRAFADRYRPWDGDAGWRVSAVIVLEDDRQIELHHDLDGRVDCMAFDAVLGRDCSGEVMNDGAPDGAVWLGLDRRSFVSTACVRQGEILAIKEDAQALRVHLERAAATAGTDSTVTKALAALDSFQREQVGTEQVNSTRPLRRALDAVASARGALSEAQNAHHVYICLARDAEALQVEANRRQLALRLVQAASARRAAEEARRDVQRARELSAKYPTAPAEVDSRDGLAQEVASAIGAWEARPSLPPLEGETAEAIARRLEALPEPPRGDAEVAAEVATAWQQYVAAGSKLEAHDCQRPAPPVFPQTGDATEQQLRDAANDLSAKEPVVDPALLEQYERAKYEAGQPHVGNTLVIALGVALVIVGGLTISDGIGLPIGIAGAALLIWGVKNSGDARRARALEHLRAIEAKLQGLHLEAGRVRQRRTEAEEWLRGRGLPTDAHELRRLAAALGAARAAERDEERWAEARLQLDSEVGLAATTLRVSLERRGVVLDGPLDTVYARYEEACTRRKETLASRQTLRDRLCNRQQLEATAADASRRRDEAQTRLERAAANCGITAASEDLLVQALRDWQDEWRARVSRARAEAVEWTELQLLLGGRTLDELAQAAHARAVSAQTFAQGLDPVQLAAVQLDADVDAQVRSLTEAANEAASELDRTKGRLAEQARTMASIPDAEEKLAAAEAELARLRALNCTLQTTRRFLESAQSRVHRTIAPRLAETVGRWLPEVTKGRYREVRVDPEALHVRVRGEGGRWRDAALLSHGTAEQIYLLLRVALAQHLVKNNEVCPLVLDDVTVQCDAERKEAVLTVLHALSRERQVILFTQEAEVLAWADGNLCLSRDRVQRLDPPPAVAA
jgi:exonuclease SbcC